jgi:hypothetical protein
VYGGTQDNGSVGGLARTLSPSGISNGDWFVTAGGDGFVSKADPKDPNIVYAESQHGAMQRVNLKTGESVSIVPQPEPASRLFAGTGIHRSSSARTRTRDSTSRRSVSIAATIAAISWKTDQRRSLASNRSQSHQAHGSRVECGRDREEHVELVLRRDRGARRVAGQGRTALDRHGRRHDSREREGGGSWRTIESFPGVPDTTQVARVVPSSHDANTVYAAFDGHMSGDYKPYLLKSTDSAVPGGRSPAIFRRRDSVRGGRRSERREHALRRHRVRSVVHAEWRAAVDAPPRGLPTIQVAISSIQKRDDDLVLATFGRGF